MFPANLEVPLEDIIDDVQLAFIAWNAYDGSAVHPGGQQPGWAEFLVREPSPVATDQQGQTVKVAAICIVAVVRRTLLTVFCLCNRFNITASPFV